MTNIFMVGTVHKIQLPFSYKMIKLNKSLFNNDIQTAPKLLSRQNPDYLEFEGSLATVESFGLVWPSLIIA